MNLVWRGPVGPEGTGRLRGAGPGCGARGRRQGLTGLVQATQVPPVWRARRDWWAWLRCPWAAAGPGRDHTAPEAPPVWRAPEGLVGLAAVPVGGGRAWPGFEPTRRAKLAARTARGRAAAHRHTQRPGQNTPTTRWPGPTAPETPAAPHATTCSANGERAARTRGGQVKRPYSPPPPGSGRPV